MIVSEVMTTKLITVSPHDTLSHAANLFRQHQFHHLPVVQTIHTEKSSSATYAVKETILLYEGLLTSQDIDLAVAASTAQQPWQERYVSERMHRSAMYVTPATSVAAAAQILVERGANCLPVIVYEQRAEPAPAQIGSPEAAENRAILIGMLTRSDLLMALAHLLGAFEPGMELHLPVQGDLSPLARLLLLAAEQHIQVTSVIAASSNAGTPGAVTVRLGTIYPAPFLVRLREAGISYTFVDLLSEGNTHAER